ncbi:uncharacterized protein LOC130443328 [Diorhabda sublineata]|uniref:uncharacterized protein LOC130443328 n=1 Tax=Diorhabda sublineata TaxID=1163346 RepID=UPI0024E16B0D|nr:uncharacterized protein LOC130443328 [Diorhabda sublineata]
MRVKKRKIVEINYPPVPTKKWIPPDERPKKSKKKPVYIKPEGITQKLEISSLRKVWHQFCYYGKNAILLGHYGQTSKKYLIKTRGLQGACNCAVACIFAYLFPMDTWDRNTIDRILDLGNNLYITSIQQDPDRCLVYVSTNKVFKSIYLDRDKISFEIDCKNVIETKFSSVAEDFVKETFMHSLETFFTHYPSGIVTMLGKYLAIWIQDEAYYLFDPTEHTEDGFPAFGVQCHTRQIEQNYPRYPPKGDGFAVLYRCLTLDDLVNFLYLNLNVHVPIAKFTLEGCTVERFTHLNLEPPEKIDDLDMVKEQMLTMDQLLERKSEPGFDLTKERLTTYLAEIEDDRDVRNLELLEIAPDVTDNLSPSKRPSWLQEPFEKSDVCKFPIPQKNRPDTISFYIDLEPEGSKGIMRADTHQTDPNFSRYKGRQSMGNAISSLIMLKFYKSRYWVPALLNKILKYGDLLYRDAMITIPRTQELKLSNFQKKTEYWDRKFTPKIEDFVVVGRLISSNFEVLDLLSALDSYLIENSCCVIIGPITLSIWIEDGKFYSFDPNGRDTEGKAISEDDLQTNPNLGRACVMWFSKLKDFVDLYMHNVPKYMRTDPFYISKVQITDYVDLPESWYNFKSIFPGVWILRGNMSQSDRVFDVVSRNFQSPAMCLVMLAMQQTLPIKEFVKETIDEVLEIGDKFYKDSIEILAEREQFTDRMLMLTDIKRNFRWMDKIVDFDVEECVSNGIFDCKENNFEKVVRDYFSNYDSGIITCKVMSVALWKNEDKYYYFDSHNRDDKGLSTPYGTACILRANHLEDLIEILLANFAPTKENYYNIHNVKITFSQVDADQLIRPIMEFYKRLSENKSILRSLYSEISNKYDLNIGKQTIPMCVMALGFNRLKPSIEWNQQDLDEILNKGDAYYTASMIEILKEEEMEHLSKIRTGNVPTSGQEISEYETKSEEESIPKKEEGSKKSEEEAVAVKSETVEEEEKEEEKDEHAPLEITLDNVKKEFNIGFNKFNVEIEDVEEGLVRPNLKEALRNFFETPQTDDYYNQEMMVITKPYSVITWRDDHVWYLFDPKPRDKEGYVIGLEDWSEFRLPKPPKQKKNKRGITKTRPAILNEPEGGDTLQNVTNYEGFTAGEGQPDYNLADYMGGEEEEIESEESEIVYPQMVHKSSSFWREKEKSGKACVLAFNRLEELIEHIFANIPPKLTPDTKFALKSVKLVNNTELKLRFNPSCERMDIYEGNWYDFEEVDRGMWILRGTMTLCNELFPKENRGKQQLPTAYVALATAYIFSIVCFNECSIDTILKYGDRLCTFIRNYRKNQLMKFNCNCGRDTRLCDDEINWVVQHEKITLKDIPKKMCLSKFMVNVDVESNVVVGDINAQNFEDTLDVKRGLSNFFENHQYGLLEAKGLTVAIWRGARMFYMFDGFNRSRNGTITPYGTACITRYLNLEKLADIFLSNLPKYGNNCFTIHNVSMTRDICPREREPKVVIPPPKTVNVGGFEEITPGKSIVRGSIHQDDPKFDRMKNSMSAPIAIVALTMTLIHKTNTWSKPIIDEIIEIGSELYDDSVETLGYDFNQWEDKLVIENVNTHYNIGVLKASCEIRMSDVKGIIDIKDPNTFNLRQGIERFFEENTHGIIVSEPITLAIWEEIQEDNQPLIYVFDPNERGPAGMPDNEGTACLLCFVNAALAATHLIGCIPEPMQKMCCFEIAPIEIIVGSMKTSCKKKKIKSSITNVSPKCAEVSEDKKFLRKYVEQQRKKKEAKRLQQLGRKQYYTTKAGYYLIRGYNSQNSPCFTDSCRNLQDIPNCIVAIVMNHLISVEQWTSKNIDLILMAGNQLYIDSYIAYGPKDPKLGMKNIVRKFYLRHLTIHVTIYKPIISEVFTVNTLTRTLSVLFTQEQYCILNHLDQWVTLFFKSGLFYMFDPHERDLEGFAPKKQYCGCGSAILMKFDEISSLATRLVQNLSKKEIVQQVDEEIEAVHEEEEEVYEENLFTLWLAAVDIK